MYHRFNESKYPSTNIQMDIFKQQIEIIEDSNYKFNDPNEFEKMFSTPKIKKEILITIDDAFLSFYQEAWPFLKKNKIPFILFVSTQPVGKKGYMTWSQIREVESEDFAFIGHHSHTHDYLINETNDQFDRSGELFFKRVLDGFKVLAEAEPNRFRVINGNRAPDDVSNEIWQIVKEKI